jgi:hypothetical protein
MKWAQIVPTGMSMVCLKLKVYKYSIATLYSENKPLVTE